MSKNKFAAEKLGNLFFHGLGFGNPVFIL